MDNRKKTLVKCKDCHKEWSMRSSSIKNWKQRCLSCSAINRYKSIKNLVRIRRYKQVHCSLCGVGFQKRLDGIKKWSGKCKSCAAKSVVRQRKPLPKCKNCSKEIKILGKSKMCKICSLKFRSGKNHYKWKKDRTQVKQYWTERNNPFFAFVTRQISFGFIWTEFGLKKDIVVYF